MWKFEAFINFISYIAVAIPLLAVGIFIFILSTPYKEFVLLKEGANSSDPQKTAAAKAVAYDLSGKIIGLTIVLASSIFNSVPLVDLAIWGGLGILLQIIVFYLFHLLAPINVLAEIPKGNVAVAIFSSNLSMITGVILAALVNY
ncbi:DUF350 domain-containing protein [Thermoflavimicrobium dichotomicum]|uniref:Putative membrane protein n=1 Tax=Thermoflavimicrobium dichotomicum TaxID=46223 RepID=A0A1I3JVZ0_9BACL|nr:DUF350 domain-containing protein [Thermoflavimicrobium dichotomicum]SFI64373.1 putative membrane protein [Thermoflavimicrobium dichotomicum]